MNKPQEKLKTNFLEEIGKAFVPKTFRPGLRQYLSKAGIHEVPYKLFGILFYVALGITALLYIGSNFYGMLSSYNPLIVGISVFAFWAISSILISFVIIMAIYFYLNMKIYARIKEMDLNLGDYLVLVSTNLKGGMSFEKSLWSSIKQEFGVLAEEMGLVSKRVMTGADLSDALKEFSDKYDSPSIKRTLDLILGEIESGGEIAGVLDQTIISLRKTKLLKEELAANTLMFTIFIGVIVVVISPLLFALAYNLLNILIDVSATIAPALSGAGNLPFQIEEVSLNENDFKIFSVMALGVISIFSAMILSIIQKGDIKGGLKFIPLFLFASITLYFIFMTVFAGVFNFI